MPAPWMTRTRGMTPPLNSMWDARLPRAPQYREQKRCCYRGQALCRARSQAARNVLAGAQAEDAGLDQPADIAERAATFEPTGAAAGRVQSLDHRTVGTAHPGVPVDHDSAERVGDAGADRDRIERWRLDRVRRAAFGRARRGQFREATIANRRVVSLHGSAQSHRIDAGHRSQHLD